MFEAYPQEPGFDWWESDSYPTAEAALTTEQETWRRNFPERAVPARWRVIETRDYRDEDGFRGQLHRVVSEDEEV